MFELRIVETLVRLGRYGREPGDWSVLLIADSVVVRDYPCRDRDHAEAVADALRRRHRLRTPDAAARPSEARVMLNA